MTINKIKVKETSKYYGDFEGSLESIISQLQSELDEGWEGIETEYERDYGDCHDHEVYYLYKHRPETDKEYDKRMKLLEKEKTEKLKAKERRRKEYEKLKKEFGDTP
jgi:transposase